MILDTLQKAIHETLQETDMEAITENTAFVDDLGADSLDVFQIMMLVEKELDIELPKEAAEGIVTVGDALEAVRRIIK